MDKVDFWRLERSVQERFVASTQGAAAPAPLAIRPLAREPRLLAFAALGLCGLLGAIATLRFGFGDLDSRYALAPTWLGAVYGGCFTLSAFGIFKAISSYVTAHAVPYRPALYLFPIGVIDARTPTFAVYRISEHTQARVDTARRCLRVELKGGAFEFPCSDTVRAEQAAATLLQLRDRLAAAGPDSSAREQSLVDPLLDNGFKNPFAPPEPLRQAVPGWVKIWPLLAIILGVLLGGAAFLVRNHLSEVRLYAAARHADSSAVYRTYLARGGQNPDVEALLLPRAELREAVQQGSVVAIERFLLAHPHTQIQPEVDAALAQALSKELSHAEATHTLSALKEFASKYRSYSFLEPSVDRAVQARVDAALAHLKPALVPNEPHLLSFVERLLHYTAKHGPEVLVRFQRKPTETLEQAEKALRQNGYFTGESSLPRHYFDAAHAAPREARASAPLIAAFNEHFPRDLLNAQAAPPLDATADPKPTLPTLLISYHTELSGAFTSRHPRLALAGIGVICKVSFEIPGDPDPLLFKLTVWRAPDLKTLNDSSNPAQLYDAMATEAFHRFTKKYLTTWFVEH